MEADENIDGSDIFWSGYVDAVTNLVLNLLFMLTISILAVFMFDLELSWHQDKVPSTVAVVAVDYKGPISLSAEQIPGIVEAKDSEIQALQKELLSLKNKCMCKMTCATRRKSSLPRPLFPNRIKIWKKPLLMAAYHRQIYGGCGDIKPD